MDQEKRPETSDPEGSKKKQSETNNAGDYDEEEDLDDEGDEDDSY